MTDMTLEQVRDSLHKLSKGRMDYVELRAMADAIDAHLAKASDYERAVTEQAMLTECVSVTGRDPSDVIRDVIHWHVSNAAQPARDYKAEMKNFHRSLCDRFGYAHDEIDWFRDQVSLEEFIARRFDAVIAHPRPTGEQAWEVAWIDHTPSGVVLRTLGKCKRLEDLPHGTKLYAHPRPVGVPDGWEIEEDGKGFVRIASPECELHIGFMPPPSLEATTMLRDLACALLAAAPDGEVW